MMSQECAVDLAPSRCLIVGQWGESAASRRREGNTGGGKESRTGCVHVPVLPALRGHILQSHLNWSFFIVWMPFDIRNRGRCSSGCFLLHFFLQLFVIYLFCCFVTPLCQSLDHWCGLEWGVGYGHRRVTTSHMTNLPKSTVYHA